MTKFKRFHVLSRDTCPFCVQLKGAIKLHLGSTADSTYRKYVKEYDATSGEDTRKWEMNFGEIIPRTYNTVPQVVVEMDGGQQLAFIGGLYDFVQTFHCPVKWKSE
jgi:glutaredoxin